MGSQGVGMGGSEDAFGTRGCQSRQMGIEYGATPLSWAAGKGHEGIGKMLWNERTSILTR